MSGTIDEGAPASVGQLLRAWRQRRHLSQLDLAVTADVSARHLSFVETGRARPSREMILHLAQNLDVPLRERNALLLAAGYAPAYRQTDLAARSLEPVRAALDDVLRGHEPYPAILVDRRWNLVAGNNAAGLLLEGLGPEVLGPPVNALRACLHPEGLASRIVNLQDWADYVIGSLRRQVLLTGDDELRSLEQELSGHVADRGMQTAPAPEAMGAFAVPLRLRTDDGELALIATLSTFGTALDITLAELTLEAFLPADEATAAVLRARAER